MTYEEKRAVTTESEDAVPAETNVVSQEPTTYVERRPVNRTVISDDPLANAMAASQLIQTIVWSVVVLILLIVALWALHVYAHLF